MDNNFPNMDILLLSGSAITKIGTAKNPNIDKISNMPKLLSLGIILFHIISPFYEDSAQS